MNESADKSRVFLFMDDEPDPIAHLSTPIQFDLDTTKLVDGPHRLKIVSRSTTGKEGLRIIDFEVRNGPAIAIEGLGDKDIVDGILPLMINAYDKGNQQKFLIAGSETPSSIPSWIWVLLIAFFAWAAYYTILYYNYSESKPTTSIVPEKKTEGISQRISVFETPSTDDPDNLTHIKQELVAPPNLPEYDQSVSKEPVVVEVELSVEEKKIEIAPGVKIWALTFNGSVPAPIIVVHQDDYVQLTLVNPSTNTLQHNIDFHAATGAMGGGDLSLVNPGEQVTFRFKATKPGVFVYHCAPGGVMVPLHVASGMNGAIMVLPRDGLKDENGNSVKYDKAFYIAEQDYYIPKDAQGNYKEYATPAAGFGDMLEVFQTLKPSHINFNGVLGSLTGSNALAAKVGDKVLFITSQANRDTRIHLIGGHADLVWLGGSFNDTPATNYESWSVIGGSAVAAMYQFREPGIYAYLNHNLIEALVFGAVAQVKVEGKEGDNLMMQLNKPEIIKI